MRAELDIDLTSDLLVIGGSLSGAWTALCAREAGASVAIVDKGWIGTAGVIAAATGGGYFLLPDDPAQRERTIRIRHGQADGLDDLAFCERVYDQSYRAYRKLEDWGFRMGRFGTFRGPDSMVFLRRRLQQQNVRILDHSPALELLLDARGTVTGAAGIQRKTGKNWRIRAGAVVLATGGNAFGSGAMGTGGLTGDGYLFAAEIGADAVGMEFSGHYGFVPRDSSCTKGGMYHFYGQIFDQDGTKLDPEPGWAAVPAAGRAMIMGRDVFARIDVAPDDTEAVKSMMPNFFNYFERNHVEPFNHLWPVGLLYEGTVRAAGGIRVGEGAATRVPGLFAVGDVADKTKLTGAQMSGAGAAIAWCVTSGEWAGAAAARFALEVGAHHAQRVSHGSGGAGLRTGGNVAVDASVKVVQEEIFPLEKNLYRDGEIMAHSLMRLDQAWQAMRDGDTPAEVGPRGALRLREAAAQLLTARWIYRAAEQRLETRGLHRRSDYPDADPCQARNLAVSGLDAISVVSLPSR
jgi:succinate dehydrogenase/fumarate reductase flavoprotein subunit